MNQTKETSFTKCYVSRLFAVVLLFGGCMFLFCSCEREENKDAEKPAFPAGEMVVLNFAVSKAGIGENEVIVRRGISPGIPEREAFSSPVEEAGGGIQSAIHIADNVYMYSALREEEAPVTLRSMPPDIGSKVRVVAYSGSPGYATMEGHADYVVISGGALAADGTPPLTVSAGTYKFVAYSFHNTVPLEPFAATTASIPSWDAIWGDTVVTVSPVTNTVHINMEHLFSRVRVQAELDTGIGSTIYNIAVPRVSHRFPTLAVQSKALTPTVAAGSSSWSPVTWTNSGGGSTWYTHYLPVYMDGNAPSLQIDSVRIDGTLYSGPWTINYTTPAVSGKEYTLYVFFTKACTALSGVSLASYPASGGTMLTGETLYLTATPSPSGATSVEYEWQYHNGTTWMTLSTTVTPTYNATVMQGANQFRVIAGNRCSSGWTSNIISMTGVTPVGGSAARITWDSVNDRYVLTTDPRDAGLYFRFGSVVGLFSGTGRYTQDLVAGVNTSYFSVADHVTINVSTVTINFIADVPYVSSANFPWPGTPVINATFHTAANVKAGFGDPCRLVGLNLNNIKSKTAGQLTKAEIDNGQWRLPTGLEQQQFSGYVAGQTITGGIWWWNQGQNPFNFTLGVAGGEFPEKNHVNGGPGKFLPAVGDRSSAGQAGRQRTRGVFMTNTPQSSSSFAGFHFDSANIYLASGYSYDWFWPVRCVPQ